METMGTRGREPERVRTVKRAYEQPVNKEEATARQWLVEKSLRNDMKRGSQRQKAEYDAKPEGCRRVHMHSHLMRHSTLRV